MHFLDSVPHLEPVVQRVAEHLAGHFSFLELGVSHFSSNLPSDGRTKVIFSIVLLQTWQWERMVTGSSVHAAVPAFL